MSSRVSENVGVEDQTGSVTECESESILVGGGGPAGTIPVRARNPETLKDLVSKLGPRLVTAGGEVVEIARLDASDELTDEDLAAELDAVEPDPRNPVLTQKIIAALFPATADAPNTNESRPNRARADEVATDIGLESVDIFDTTMRDGQRAYCASMGADDRLAVAKSLAAAKVKVIELGHVGSEADCRAIQKIAPQIVGPKLCVLARCTQDLSEVHTAVRILGVVPRNRARVHVALVGDAFKEMLCTPDGRVRLYDSIGQNVALVHRAGIEVEFTVEDGATIDEFDFVIEAFEAAVAAGATVLDLADSSGLASPEAIAQRTGWLCQRFANHEGEREKIIISVHCHNDMGLAVANSLAGCSAGARQVHCTVNGIGRRAGNAALEEVVTNIYERPHLYRLQTSVERTHLAAISLLVSAISGLPLSRNKPIVGAEAAFPRPQGGFTHAAFESEASSGVPTQAKVSRWLSVEGIRERLEELGLQPNPDQAKRVHDAYKALRETKLEIFDSDLIALMFDRLKPLPPRGTWRLDHFSCSTGNAVQPQAHVRLIDPEGQPLDAMGNGQGTIDAICNAIARVTSIPVNVASFEMKSVTHGGDAQAQTTLELKLGRRIYLGRGVSVDILRAVVMACLNAVNEIYWERLRGYIPGAEMDESDDPYLHYSEAGRVIPFSEVS